MNFQFFAFREIDFDFRSKQKRCDYLKYDDIRILSVEIYVKVELFVMTIAIYDFSPQESIIFV